MCHTITAERQVGCKDLLVCKRRQKRLSASVSHGSTILSARCRGACLQPTASAPLSRFEPLRVLYPFPPPPRRPKFFHPPSDPCNAQRGAWPRAEGRAAQEVPGLPPAGGFVAGRKAASPHSRGAGHVEESDHPSQSVFWGVPKSGLNPTTRGPSQFSGVLPPKVV